MNRFFKNFIVLPLIFFVFFFHAGAIGACSCGSVLPGQKVTITIWNKKKNESWEPKTTAGKKNKQIAQEVIAKLMFEINKFYFFKVNDKNNGLIEAVKIWRDKFINVKNSEDVKAADSFMKAFFSSKNNYFYRFDFQSQKILELENDEEVLIEFHFSEVEKNEKKVDLKIRAYFQEDKNTKNQKKWSFLLKINQVKIIRSNQGVLKSFNFQESNLEIDKLKVD